MRRRTDHPIGMHPRKEVTARVTTDGVVTKSTCSGSDSQVLVPALVPAQVPAQAQAQVQVQAQAQVQVQAQTQVQVQAQTQVQVQAQVPAQVQPIYEQWVR